jgi:hypothetical protein
MENGREKRGQRARVGGGREGGTAREKAIITHSPIQ